MVKKIVKFVSYALILIGILIGITFGGQIGKAIGKKFFTDLQKEPNESEIFATLKDAAVQINKDCPRVIDKETRLDGVEVSSGLKCTYYHTLLNYTKDDINIDVDNNYLAISASKENKVDEKDKNYIRKERSDGKYSRSFYIGNVSEKDIEAEFKDGILKVSVPKEEKENSKKKIDIK